MIRFAWAAVLVLGTLPSVSAADYDYQEKWGTRDPVACGPFTVDEIPADSLNSVLATTIYKCAKEAIAVGGEEYLNLVEDLKFQVAKPRPFGTDLDDYLIDNADQEFPVYPARVSQTSVRCHFISDILENDGKNCRETPEGGEGHCFVSVFGEWNCHVFISATGPTVWELPPRQN